MEAAKVHPIVMRWHVIEPLLGASCVLSNYNLGPKQV